ncbi:MAG: dihydroxy-acid dehydratase, partial [Actinobacteria bacterium]|nr:dihydroxy-acid dehydratase [Actinomycetota bacterium]
MSEEKFSRRSQYWFGLKDKGGYIHRERLRNQGFPNEVFDGRPVIGIANTWSELNPCNGSLDTVAEAVKRGVWEAGGFPLEFPAMSLSESLQRPTTMLYRNMLAMEVEELIRSHPIDGVVLLGNCDKTPPGLLMGAASVDLPSIMITGGPMLNGRYRGEAVGSGTLVWRYSEKVRTGEISFEEFMAMESCSARSQGSCMTMGTASTMACVTEALGVQLPGVAAIPAVDSRKFTMAHLTGRRIVQMVEEDLKLSKVLNRKAFENAIKVLSAIGGSTNAVVHLLAIAGRVGVKLSLEDFDKLGKDVPVVANMMPSGKYLMEEFFDAGGVPAVMQEISNLLNMDHVTVTGKSVKENIAGTENFNPDVITRASKPFQKAGSGIVVLRGSLAPDGAIMKVAAASPNLLTHKGKALVFDTIEEYLKVADDANLPVTKDSVLVLKNAGPKGYPGFPEVGNLPMPKKMLDQGVTDMVRVSDARMSGTAYGTVVLHTSPEAAIGGPLALVQNGDEIELDVPNRKINLLVSDEELAKRKSNWKAPAARADRGWSKMYIDHVQQANLGADLDFLVGGSGDGI